MKFRNVNFIFFLIVALAFILVFWLFYENYAQKKQIALIQTKVIALESRTERLKQLLSRSQGAEKKQLQDELFRLLGNINQNSEPKKILVIERTLWVQNKEILTQSSFLDLMAFLLDEQLLISIELPKSGTPPGARKALLELGVPESTLSAPASPGEWPSGSFCRIELAKTP